MVAKLSSVRIISAASLVTSVPVMPIATPMSARVSAGASFTPSPVMATMFPCCLRMLTRRTLSSGATRATTPMSSTSARSCVVGHRGELGAGERPAFDAELPGDGRRRRGVVAGDHADADAGVLAQRDGVLGLLARRVDDADEGEQLQIGDERQQVARRVERGRVEVAPRDRQHAQALAGQPIVLGEDPLAGLVAHRRRRSVGVRGSATSGPAARRARP